MGKHNDMVPIGKVINKAVLSMELNWQIENITTGEPMKKWSEIARRERRARLERRRIERKLARKAEKDRIKANIKQEKTNKNKD